jgi:hypothetical protein
MEKEFTIRSYGYGELAQLYFPNIAKKSASVQLRRWINQDKQLNELLKSLGYKKGQRLFTPRQVQILVEKLGMP